MNISIHPNVFTEFNENFAVGILHCSDIDNSRSPVDIQEMLRDIEEYIKLTFTKENAKTHHLVSAWNAAIAHYGDKFHHYHTNVERLMQQILDGGELASTTKINDLANFFALKNLVPTAVIDADRINNPQFKVIKNMSPLEEKENNELILSDGDKVVARQLNYEIDKKYTAHEKTKNALIYIETIPPASKQQLEKMMQEISALVRIFCKGKVKRIILDKANKKVSL